MNLDSNDKKGKRSIGFSFAWNGLVETIRTERNFQIHILAALVVIIIGLVVNLTVIEWSIILLVIGLVFITEMINTTIEKLIDYLKPDIHPAAKIIKDTAAGAVLMSAIIAVFIGLIIFLPKLYDFIYPIKTLQ